MGTNYGASNGESSGEGRIWTAVIEADGKPRLYAWMAYNAKFDTFATDNPKHARMFKSRQDVEAWIARLKIKDAKPIRMKD
ncbi:hypothetical protein [Singulisphaera sp. PoT]|uniref:hypothetical protein n=1 Tax=Singulisphaera sp. PoT TaxID=3411797 RepID=UPI003BF52911